MFEARRCLSCGNCIECDGCLGACPEDAVIKLGPGLRYQLRLRPLHRLPGVLRAVPGAFDRDDPGRGAGSARMRSWRPAIRWTGVQLMRATVDGNEAAASVAYRCSEVCCIFPITPSSPMAEFADEWSSKGRTNLWGTVPAVVEMQSEARRRRRAARRAPGRRARDDVHGLAGPAADDPEHVQDRRGADLGGDARGRALAGRAGAVDLRRPLRRDGGPPDGLRAAGCGVGAGGPRPRARGPRRDARDARPVRALLRRLPHLARAADDRDARRRGRTRADLRRAGPGAPRAVAVARAAVHPGHRAEPRHLLPGARDGQPVLRARARTSCRARWTGSPSGPAPLSASSSTAATRRPSACSW